MDAGTEFARTLSKFVALVSIVIVLAASMLLFSVVLDVKGDSSECFETVVEENTSSTGCTSLSVSLTASIPSLHKVDATCSPPTVAKGNQCILDSDLRLGETLGLAPFTRLNCQGHKLTPTRVGSPTVSSNPEVAVLLNNVNGVKVQNCDIEGFDFGVEIVNSKVAEDVRNDPKTLASLSNRILSNTIIARYGGVQILNADNSEIKDNDITLATGAGRGIAILSDSDLNRISNNKITGRTGSPEPLVILPGTSPYSAHTVGVVTSSLSFLPLINMRLGDTLVQIVWKGNETRPDNNLIDGNKIDMIDPSGHRLGIVLGDLDRGSVVRENIVLHPSVGIAATASPLGDRIVAGSCSLDPTRRSTSDSDCFILGIDATSKGVSTGTTTLPSFDTRSGGNLIEKNSLSSQGDGVQISLNYKSIIRSNTITGSARSAVLLADKGLETATVARNIISGNAHGLFLIQTPESQFFGAKVSLNDITRSLALAIGANQGYTLPTELSVSGRGNYWGRSCSEGGFLPDDSPDYLLIKDSHPYGVTVATTSDQKIPKTCK